MNIFVDANILLGVYGLTTAELEELRKLGALIDEGELVLWVPQNLKDEFYRNRAKVLSEAVRPLRESRLKVSFPSISEGLPEREALQAAVKSAQVAHSALVQRLDQEMAHTTLEADTVIGELFDRATVIPTSHLMQRARDRRDLRKPPGKSDSLGDALNWEALLKAVPADEDIHVVTSDPDFRSPLGDWSLHECLREEWENKGGKPFLYRDLGAFSKKNFPALDLATDVPKLKAINELRSSASFSQTHAVIARLSAFDLFTPEQAHMLLAAAAENSQVRWIARDEDVLQLLRRVIDAHRTHVDPNVIAVLEREMHPPAPVPVADGEDEDLPF